jgi:small-conductance mechanosensitive channel
VRFSGFAEAGIAVEVVCWVDTRDYDTYTRVVEELNLRLLDVVESAGACFAVRTRALLVASPGALTAEISRAPSGA